ncbi:hypothetical protein RRG08_033948 [Elysia crispata]|uniref:Uncharacterized protein n=1 Tax=Elysia crispata TaxID=231223 RepID=A0AAE0YS26_9GAST|nr:hypothetical protein RRG08_033948 [Elysia crispata]
MYMKLDFTLERNLSRLSKRGWRLRAIQNLEIASVEMQLGLPVPRLTDLRDQDCCAPSLPRFHLESRCSRYLLTPDTTAT